VEQETISSLQEQDSYNAEDIQVLKGLEAVRRRPGMYIGGTDQRGFHHLTLEVVYNSIDEAVAGYCNQIRVTLCEDGGIRVEDNGRGIPIDTHPDTGVSALETVMTVLHAGAKFGGTAYRVSGGLHGVGVSVVNALSSWLKVEVRRDGQIYCQEYCRGIPQGEMSVEGESTGSGTLITFIPDLETFGQLTCDFDFLAQRLRELAYLVPGLEIKLYQERGERELSFCFEGGIGSFVRYLDRKKTVLHPKPIYISRESNGTMVEAALQYTDSYSEFTMSFANCINTVEGGSHLTGFRSALTRVLNDYARKTKLCKENETAFVGEDVREGLTAVLSVEIPDPQFEGQIKAKLANSEARWQVESAVAEGLFIYLEQQPNEARRILEKCFASARTREAMRKAREQILKKGMLDFSSLSGKLAECSDKDPSQCEVYLVEGDSAGGSAKQGRDRRFQAILPLKGKILNVEKASPDKMLTHDEIRALITALGVGINEGFDLSKLRYHRVIIMTDADVDGAHIRTLLLAFFFRYMTELIQQGHLFIAQPPLYGVRAGKEQRWLYSEGEKDKALQELKGKKVQVQRYKGLGEMSPDQLWETTMDPSRRTMLRVEIEDAVKADQMLHTLMGEDVPPRRAFIQAHARSVRNLDV